MAPFKSSKLKIERANQHIRELESAFGDFLKSNPHRLSIEKDAKGLDVLTLESIRPMPALIPLVIGDALHNLRSALDHLAYEIVADSGRTPSRSVAFPFAKGREELVDSLRNGEIETAAGATIIDLIVDTVRPYQGGNDALYALHALDIVDKHHLVVPVVTLVGLVGVFAEDSNHNVFQDISLSVGEGGKLNAIATSGALKITDYGRPAFAVVFAKDQAFEGQPVLPTLHQLAQLVSGVVEAIENAYTPRAGEPLAPGSPGTARTERMSG